MKKITFYIIAILLFFGCKKDSTMTIVTQGIKGEILAFKPIDNSYCIYANDTLSVCTGDTTFVLNSSTDGLAHSCMFGSALSDELLNTIIGEDFSIYINNNNGSTEIKFEGKNAAGRELYNSICSTRDLYKYEWIKDYQKFPVDTSATKMKENFEKIYNSEIAGFDSLLRNNEIESDFYNFVKNDTKLYYNTVISKIISMRLSSGERLFNDYGKIWEEIYNTTPITTQIFTYQNGTEYTKYFLEYYLLYKNPEINLSINSYDEYITNLYERIENNIAEPEAAKRYLAKWLLLLCLNNKTFDKTVVELTDKYTTCFPESEINNYFNAHKKEIENYYKIVEADINQEIRFVDGYENIETLEQLISKFKGEKIFVDFWFSTCGPCIEEFKHNGELKKFLKENDIKSLYISVDEVEMDEKWKNAIKYYNLEGNHVRASQKLREELFEIHKINHFPTYLLINKNGEIVEKKAFRPSSGEKLYNQIKEKLN